MSKPKRYIKGSNDTPFKQLQEVNRLFKEYGTSCEDLFLENVENGYVQLTPEIEEKIISAFEQAYPNGQFSEELIWHPDP